MAISSSTLAIFSLISGGISAFGQIQEAQATAKTIEENAQQYAETTAFNARFAAETELFNAQLSAETARFNATQIAESERYNADVLRHQADLVKARGRLDVLQQKKVAISTKATQEALYSKSGVIFSGSPLIVMEESAANAELDILTTEFNTFVEASGFTSEALERERVAAAAIERGEWTAKTALDAAGWMVKVEKEKAEKQIKAETEKAKRTARAQRTSGYVSAGKTLLTSAVNYALLYNR
jgi:hypothetical protein